MAVKPSDCTQLAEEERLLVAHTEQWMDEHLLRNYLPGQPLWVGVRGLNERTKTELLRRYTAAGWRVRFTCDQREGSAFVFEGPHS